MTPSATRPPRNTQIFLARLAIRCRFVDRLVEPKVSYLFPANGSLLVAPLFPRSGPSESGSPMSQVVLRCYDFPFAHTRSLILFRFRAPRYPPRFVSRRLRSRKVGGCLPGQDHCSAGDPIAGVLSRGREWDLPGSQAIRPVSLPRSATPAEPTIPRLLVVSSILPPLHRQRRLQRVNHLGAIARLQHLLPTLQEWCCHHPCKARFRLAGSPLPGGS
jgi:hypothetical protein